MTDFRPEPSKPPSFLTLMASSVARHALTGAASAFVAHGVFLPAQANEFVDVGCALVLYVFGLWWSGIQNKNTRSPQAA